MPTFDAFAKGPAYWMAHCFVQWDEDGAEWAIAPEPDGTVFLRVLLDRKIVRCELRPEFLEYILARMREEA